MSTVLVTGATAGIGVGVARAVEAGGDRVIYHARDDRRREELTTRGAQPADVVVGDFSSLRSTVELAQQVKEIGAVDVVVHNAGWQAKGGPRPVTVDGLETTFQVNVVAPYLLCALLPPAKRLVFVSSDSISRGCVDMDDLQHERDWTAGSAYADSKLAVTMLAMAWARRYPGTLSNAVHPGWVQTNMSIGSAAPLSVDEGADTPAWLAVSEDPAVRVSGRFFFARQEVAVNEAAYDRDRQERLLDACRALTGVVVP